MVSHLRRNAAATTLLLVAAALLATTPAAAEPDLASGLWYYDTGFAQANAQGINGQGVTIAIIDSPINTAVPELTGATINTTEPSPCQWSQAYENVGEPVATVTTDRAARHGTDVTSLIVGNGTSADAGPGITGVAQGVEVNYYTYGVPIAPGQDLTGCWQGTSDNSNESMTQAIDKAIADGAEVISISVGYTWDKTILDAIARALAHDVVVVAGIDNSNGFGTGISAMNGVLSVQRSGPTGEVTENAVSDERIDIVAPGNNILTYGVNESGQWLHKINSGTSLATPIVAGSLALIMSKYPDATANQALQALLRNTDVEDHPFGKSSSGYYGYGPLNITRALAVDPTQYPDENPLISDSIGESPSLDEINAARADLGEAVPTPSATEPSPPPTDESAPPTASPAPTASPTPSETTNTGLIVALVAVAVVLTAGVLIVIVIVSRKKRPQP